MRQHPSTCLAFALALWLCPLAAAARQKPQPQPRAPLKLSHVRVVRLSFVEGTVTLRKQGETSWSNAILNTPIEQGFSIATTLHSFAEVEFENGSTLRLGEGSSLSFTELALTPQGGRINQLTLDDGYATLNVIPERRDEYAVNAAGVALVPQGKAEFRSDVSLDALRVEVFGGRVQATGGASNQAAKLDKNDVLTSEVAGGAASTFKIAGNLQKDDWDKWTAARDRVSSVASQNSGYDSPPALFGFDDLVAYGDWAYFPGHGYGWAPYEPLGWSPYASGAWDWYSGWGYTWISGEPWGWLPFHYGNWAYDPAFGWFWLPGSSLEPWDFGPALVDWFEGPGWIGWVPAGAGGGGAPSCSPGVAGCLTAVPPRVITKGEPVRPGSPPIVVNLTSPGGIKRIGEAEVPTMAAQPGAADAPLAKPIAASFVRGSEGAPASVIMGQQVSAGAVLTGAFHDKPIHVALGTTFGGRIPVNAKPGKAAAVPLGVGTRSLGASGSLGGGSKGPQIVSAHSGNVGPGGGFAGGFAGGAHGGAAAGAGGFASGGGAGGGGGSHGGGGGSGGGGGGGGAGGSGAHR